MTSTYHMKAHEQLFSLGQAFRMYDGITAELCDNRLEVTRKQPEGFRRDTITCSPRPSDFDKLWFWDSKRQPISEADKIPDAAMHIAKSLKPTP